MNKKQEVAAWIFGLVFAATAADSGEGAFVEHCVPVLIVATLALFSLRTRSTNSTRDAKTLAIATTLIAIAAGGSAWRHQQIGAIQEATEAAEEAQADADDAKTRVEAIEAIPSVAARLP